MNVPHLSALQLVFRTLVMVAVVLVGGTASGDSPQEPKDCVDMDVALDYGCSSAGCPNLDCTNMFLGAVNFYYGITAPQNTRMAYTAFRMAHECGDPRAIFFMRQIEAHGRQRPGG